MTAKKEIVPSWVYSMADYCQMFDLKKEELASLRLLDFPGGLSSFNAEMHEQGYRVTSGDPIYGLSFSEMEALSKKIFEANQAYLKSHEKILQGDQDLDVILKHWEKSLSHFLNDYEKGKSEKRYQKMQLPKFPFEQEAFDIGLCSDHLFHTEATSLKDQQQIIEELCRVAKEVRVFPLLDENGKIAENLGHVMLTSQQKGLGIEVREVSYHEMKGSNAMLRIWSTACAIDS